MAQLAYGTTIGGQPAGGSQLVIQQVSPPGGLTATVQTSGTVGANLAANTTYTYAVTSVTNYGQETTASASVSATEGSTAYPIALSWTPPTGDVAYVNIYKNGYFLASVPATQSSFTDDGSLATTTKTPPSSNPTGSATIGGSLTVTGSIAANGGLTVPAGQTLTNNGSWAGTKIPNSMLAGNLVSGITAGSGISVTNPSGVGSATITNAGVLSFNGRAGAVTPAAGDYTVDQVTNAVARRSSVREVLLSSTSATTVASYTPAANGNFLVAVYFRVVTAATAVTVQITYSDAAGAQTMTLLNGVSEAVGSYSLPIAFISATTASPINVVVTAGTANQVYASAAIVGV